MEKKRILYITTIGSTMGFFNSLIKSLVDDGNTVDIATNNENNTVPQIYYDLGSKVFNISCSRRPFKEGNIQAISQIRNIVRNGNYDIVHCHTPIAAMCTRIACKSLRKNGLKVIYTAHGFHFYKGAPLKNWVLYYPMERVLARYTDTLITINKEDYYFARKKLKTKNIEYVPGVGIDIKTFLNCNIDKEKKRAEIGVPNTAYMIFSAGELNENKNHKVVIEALSKINNSKIHYVIAGNGDGTQLMELAKKHNINMHILGHRKDMPELYKTTDLYIHPSKREGLSVALMEAAVSGAKCIASNIRGNNDILDSSNLFEINDIEKLVDLIRCSPETRLRIKGISIAEVNKKMIEIYSQNNR